jgi:hypothetical protein
MISCPILRITQNTFKIKALVLLLQAALRKPTAQHSTKQCDDKQLLLLAHLRTYLWPIVIIKLLTLLSIDCFLEIRSYSSSHIPAIEQWPLLRSIPDRSISE